MNEIFSLAKPSHITAAAAYLLARGSRIVRLGFLALTTGARMTPMGNNRALLQELSARSRPIKEPE